MKRQRLRSPRRRSCGSAPPRWVGTESLIEHRASVEGVGTPAPPDLLRLSVGIEDSTDLIKDLEQALAAAQR